MPIIFSRSSLSSRKPGLLGGTDSPSEAQYIRTPPNTLSEMSVSFTAVHRMESALRLTVYRS